MLPRAHRLRRSADFTHALHGGSRARSRLLVVSANQAAPGAPTRVGFVVSRAVGNAVTRNRVRRRLRHLVADRLTAAGPGLAVVVRALPDAANASFDELGRALDTGLARVRSRLDDMGASTTQAGVTSP